MMMIKNIYKIEKKNSWDKNGDSMQHSSGGGEYPTKIYQ